MNTEMSSLDNEYIKQEIKKNTHELFSYQNVLELMSDDKYKKKFLYNAKKPHNGSYK